VRVVEQPTTRHVGGEVDYDQSPPAGGDHDPAWPECGVYDEPTSPEPFASCAGGVQRTDGEAGIDA